VHKGHRHGTLAYGRGHALDRIAPHIAGDGMREVWDLFQAGDVAGAEAKNNELKPVYAAMGVTTNPIPVKAALEMTGRCPATMRLPMVEATEEQKAEIRTLIEQTGITLSASPT